MGLWRRRRVFETWGVWGRGRGDDGRGGAGQVDLNEAEADA